jgi:hypothetical protein
MNRSTWLNLGYVAASIAVMAATATVSNGGAEAKAQAPAATRPVPVFDVDATWPKLPNNWIVGHVASVAVDRRDHVWMLHRPNTIPEERRKQAAPPVLEFDASGKFVNAWGGPGSGYDWPDSEHGIAVDYKDNVWIGGSAPIAPSLRKLDDDMLLKFDNKGKFLLQIGSRSVSKGNGDTKNVHQSADVFVWPKTNEAFIADGYGNRRIIVLDADTGAFKRMWGAFGNSPLEPAPAGRGGARHRWPRLATVRQPGARGEGIERRIGLCGRPSQPPGAGVYAGRQVRDADVHQPIRAVGAVRGRARLLSGHAAAIPLRRRLRQLAHRSARAEEPSAALSVRAMQREAW